MPVVAKAVAGAQRRVASVFRVFDRAPYYYYFRAERFDVCVLLEDFAKILPYIQDGTLDPLQYPAPLISGRPGVRRDIHTIDQWDPAFYRRVLDLLITLFPDTYPTSN